MKLLDICSGCRGDSPRLWFVFFCLFFAVIVLQVKEIVAASNYVIAMANAARDYRTRNMELVDQCEITFEIVPWIAVSTPILPHSSIRMTSFSVL